MSFAVLLILLAIALCLGEWLYFNLVVRTVPGPWGWPLIGCLPHVMKHVRAKNATRFFEDLKCHYGATIYYKILGIGPILQINRPEDVTHVLASNFANYPKPNLMVELMGSLFGRGIFVTNGHEWVEQRKAGSRAFRVHDVRHSVEIFGAQTMKMVSLLHDQNGCQVDVAPLCASVTLSSFTKLALSDDSFSTVTLTPTDFAIHFDRAVQMTSNRFQNPFWKLGPRFIQDEFDLAESIAFIDKSIFQVVRKGRARMNQEETEQDMLMHFLKSIPNATDQYLRDVLFNFILAGRDTTSITLAMALYYLALNPKSQNIVSIQFITSRR